jgi:hypothetical protein
MPAAVIEQNLAGVLSAQVPMVDRNGDGIVDSQQIAYMEEVNNRLATIEAAVLDTSAVDVLQTADYCDYESVAASQTDQVMGTTGGAGDVIADLMVYPATTSPGAVTLKDGSTTVCTFAGGASSVDNLKPFTILPSGIVGAKSVSGAWKVTTGANVSALALGRFNQAALTPLVDTYIISANGGEQYNNTAGTTFTFSNVTVGTADFRRRGLFAFQTNAGSAATHSSLAFNGGTINGTFLEGVGTNDAQTANTNFLSLWYVSIPDGTVLTSPVLTCSAAPSRCHMMGVTLGRGTMTGTPIRKGQTSTSNLTGGIDVPQNGFVLAVSSTANEAATCAWTGVTQQGTMGSANSTTEMSLAWYQSVSGAEVGRTITADWSAEPSANTRMIAVAFGAVVTS